MGLVYSLILSVAFFLSTHVIAGAHRTFSEFSIFFKGLNFLSATSIPQMAQPASSITFADIILQTPALQITP
jgi:hypothetical protein